MNKTNTEATGAFPKINVIFRSCDVVTAVHHAPRPFNLDKLTLIKICFKSLYDALQGYNYHIVVLGDKISDNLRNFFQQHNVELIEGSFGNDASIRETVKIAQRFPDDEWVYFCEDDYLHTPDAIKKINTLLQERESIVPASIKFKRRLRKREITLLSVPRFINKPDIVVFPADYPDRYEQAYSARDFIFHTSDSHWRQISDVTFTFIMRAGTVKQKAALLNKASHRANDRLLSKKLFGKSFFTINNILGLSPMPGVATHMHTQTMSPLADWETIVQKYLNELGIHA
ncbi:hypothetical protein ACLI1A_14045 [Flavobacterium sp. RHBU_3]|uniref:hypothetical protein n=1 Tax=Flavobacterium sp. RHBU_3 TaxID=3391184 RepID=UPI0039856125